MTAHSTGKACAVTLLALVLAGGAGERADATTSLTITGTASGMIGSTPFSGDAITAVGTFDWSTGVGSPSLEAAYHLTSLSFDIAGEGLYTSIDPSQVLAVVVQPAIAGDYLVYFQTESGAFFGENFAAETWDAATGTDLLSGPLSAYPNLPFTVLLTASGSLTISDFTGLDATASVLVPEPASLSLLGLGLATTGLLRRRRSAA